MRYGAHNVPLHITVTSNTGCWQEEDLFDVVHLVSLDLEAERLTQISDL